MYSRGRGGRATTAAWRSSPRSNPRRWACACGRAAPCARRRRRPPRRKERRRHCSSLLPAAQHQRQRRLAAARRSARPAGGSTLHLLASQGRAELRQVRHATRKGTVRPAVASGATYSASWRAQKTCRCSRRCDLHALARPSRRGAVLRSARASAASGCSRRGSALASASCCAASPARNAAPPRATRMSTRRRGNPHHAHLPQAPGELGGLLRLPHKQGHAGKAAPRHALDHLRVDGAGVGGGEEKRKRAGLVQHAPASLTARSSLRARLAQGHPQVHFFAARRPAPPTGIVRRTSCSTPSSARRSAASDRSKSASTGTIVRVCSCADRHRQQAPATPSATPPRRGPPPLRETLPSHSASDARCVLPAGSTLLVVGLRRVVRAGSRQALCHPSQRLLAHVWPSLGRGGGGAPGCSTVPGSARCPGTPRSPPRPLALPRSPR
eukprot:scaffold5697_cov363-Prasinococcus_capsulatus_cf.AAC.1